MEQEIVDYITQAERHGLTEFEIKQNLLNAGWEAGTVEQNFVFARAADAKNQTITNQNNQYAPQGQMIHPTELAVFEEARSVIPSPISDQDFQPQPGNTFKLKRSILAFVLILVVLLLAGGAFAYYKFVYVNPGHVWQQFLENKQADAYSSDFDFTYSDPGQVNNTSTPGFLSSLKDIKLEFSGNAYLNTTDKDNIQSSSTISYSFSSGNTSFSTGLDYSLINDNLYIKISDNPFLSMLNSGSQNSQNIEWVKINLAQLEKEGNSDPADGGEFLKEMADPDFKLQLQKIWGDATLIKVDKYLGKDTIFGKTTLHFQNSFDKDALKSLASNYIDALTNKFKGTPNEVSTDQANLVKEALNQLIDKIQVKQFETWIGKDDSKLYKVAVTVNAPSFISLVNNSAELNLSNSGDSKRIADVRQISSALEEYYNDNGGYPEGVKGVPADIIPSDISQMPVAPPADGNCTEYFNGYWYKPMGTKTLHAGKNVYSSYQMTFCLGDNYGIYKGGIAKLSPSGIDSNIPCPATADLCVNPSVVSQADKLKNKVHDFIDKLDFSAELKITSQYSGFGKIIPVVAPANSIDILSSLTSAQSISADVKRLADARQIATALELYFNDKNSYPDTLSQLTPMYIGQIPTAPTSTSASCTPTDNAYSYKKLAPEKYSLNFCLGSQTGGYLAGKHTLTEAGIQ